LFFSMRSLYLNQWFGDGYESTSYTKYLVFEPRCRKHFETRLAANPFELKVRRAGPELRHFWSAVGRLRFYFQTTPKLFR